MPSARMGCDPRIVARTRPKWPQRGMRARLGVAHRCHHCPRSLGSLRARKYPCKLRCTSPTMHVCAKCLLRAVGRESMDTLWIPIAPAIGRNVPGGFRCVAPTGVGVSAFGDTDFWCQCTRSGPTAKSYPSGLFFFGPSGAHVAAEGHREPSLGNRNPFVS